MNPGLSTGGKGAICLKMDVYIHANKRDVNISCYTAKIRVKKITYGVAIGLAWLEKWKIKTFVLMPFTVSFVTTDCGAIQQHAFDGELWLQCVL